MYVFLLKLFHCACFCPVIERDSWLEWTALRALVRFLCGFELFPVRLSLNDGSQHKLYFAWFGFGNVWRFTRISRKLYLSVIKLLTGWTQEIFDWVVGEMRDVSNLFERILRLIFEKGMEAGSGGLCSNYEGSGCAEWVSVLLTGDT